MAGTTTRRTSPPPSAIPLPSAERSVFALFCCAAAPGTGAATRATGQRAIIRGGKPLSCLPTITRRRCAYHHLPAHTLPANASPSPPTALLPSCHLYLPLPSAPAMPVTFRLLYNLLCLFTMSRREDSTSATLHACHLPFCTYWLHRAGGTMLPATLPLLTQVAAASSPSCCAYGFSCLLYLLAVLLFSVPF